MYQLVIEDVVANVRDAFLDEGVDEQVLQEMKQIWTNRLMASKAVEVAPEPQAPTSGQPPPLANNPKVNIDISQSLKTKVQYSFTETTVEYIIYQHNVCNPLFL